MSMHQLRISSFLARRGFATGLPTEELARGFTADGAVRFAVAAAGLNFAGTLLADRLVLGLVPSTALTPQQIEERVSRLRNQK
jgi:hypothetical protein